MKVPRDLSGGDLATELVARQLEVRALNWETSVAGKSPITDSLRGVVSLPPGLEVKDVVVEERLRKHEQ